MKLKPEVVLWLYVIAFWVLQIAAAPIATAFMWHCRQLILKGHKKTAREGYKDRDDFAHFYDRKKL